VSFALRIRSTSEANGITATNGPRMNLLTFPWLGERAKTQLCQVPRALVGSEVVIPLVSEAVFGRAAMSWDARRAVLRVRVSLRWIEGS
jgi:hypothetical protein